MTGLILNAEAGAAFDELTRTNLDDKLTRQTRGDWPNTFRASRFIPAVDYINANRHRYLLMQKIFLRKQFLIWIDLLCRYN